MGGWRTRGQRLSLYVGSADDSLGSLLSAFLLLARCFESYQFEHRRTVLAGSFHSTSHSRKPCHKFASLTMPTTASTPLNLLRAPQVCSKLKISRTTLYAKLDKSSKYYDPDFPKQIKLGPSSVGWVEHQVDQWIINKLAGV